MFRKLSLFFAFLFSILLLHSIHTQTFIYSNNSTTIYVYTTPINYFFGEQIFLYLQILYANTTPVPNNTNVSFYITNTQGQIVYNQTQMLLDSPGIYVYETNNTYLEPGLYFVVYNITIPNVSNFIFLEPFRVYYSNFFQNLQYTSILILNYGDMLSFIAIWVIITGLLDLYIRKRSLFSFLVAFLLFFALETWMILAIANNVNMATGFDKALLVSSLVIGLTMFLYAFYLKRW